MPLDANIISTAFLCFWLAVLGAVLGSFLDCAVSRWAAGEAWHTGRSRCTSCGRTLGAAELVPVFSFLFCRGRCRHCGGRIPAECLIAELAGAGAFACLGARFGPGWVLVQWLIAAALLLWLSLVDWKKQVIPDFLLLALAANRILWYFPAERPEAGELPGRLAQLLLSQAVPAGLLTLVLLAERLWGREVMGGGDLKLLFALALYLSWAELLLGLLLACLLGLLCAALAGKEKGAAVPFGPFLSAGAALSVCFGGPVITWYFSLF